MLVVHASTLNKTYLFIYYLFKERNGTNKDINSANMLTRKAV
jgi:hypothetical protein